MNGTHRIRESKGKRMGARLGNDFEWAKEFFREFLGGPCGTDVLRFNKDLIGDLEIWRWVTTSVGGDGVSALRLRDGCSEMLMEVIKINSKLTGTIGGKITFRVNGYVRMVAFIGKERGYSSCGVWSVIICEFCDRK